MEGFPADFTAAAFRQLSNDQSTEFARSQAVLLGEIRKQIYNDCTFGFHQGHKVYTIRLPHQLKSDATLQLARELIDRFPGQVYYRHTFSGGDCDDQWRPMTEPKVSYAYRIEF